MRKIMFIGLLGAAVLLWASSTRTEEWDTRPHKDEYAAGILFVGDIMLARGVETLAEREGLSYPFSGIRDLFAAYEAVVGNFEGVIPDKHQRTTHGSLRFSIHEAFVSLMAREGITHLTLANNHAYDFGKEGYSNTRAVLASANIASSGHPHIVNEKEILYHDAGAARVAIIPQNTVPAAPPSGGAAGTLAEATEHSDFQIIFIHWGDEYAPSANPAQRAATRALIDAGADAVIGHHPHVVQNIEVYRGVPIFYSLGNFIFDQYWNEEVQTGLAVGLSFSEREARFTLIPVESITKKSSPRPLGRGAQETFLADLAERSEESLRAAITGGTITVPFAPQPNYILVH